MEPRIQYTKTMDGVNIAYWTLGVGTPFMLMPSSMLSPSMRHWATERGRRWFTRPAENRMLIRYDNRGCGYSGGDHGSWRRIARPPSSRSGRGCRSGACACGSRTARASPYLSAVGGSMCGERITQNFSIAEAPAGENGKARHLYGTGPP